MHVLARVLLLLAAVAALPAQGPTLRLATWNLEFFGNRKDAPRTDADIAAMATYLRERRVDILAMQEVGTPEAVQTLASHLGAGWQFVLGTTGMWNDGSGGQRVGFLWNSARVALVQAEELMQLPREVEDGGRKMPIFHRVPVCAVFRCPGGLDFRAVTVHLKADVRRELEEKGRDELSTRKRIAEVRELARLLGALLADANEDHDVVVLGDFNHILARERSRPEDKQAKADADLGVPLLAPLQGFARLTPPRPRPTIRWFPEAIDHVIVNRDLDEEVIAGSLQVHSPWPDREPSDGELAAYQKTYSDHFLVSVDLAAGVDRDPHATFAPVGAKQELRALGTAAPIAPVATPLPVAAPRAFAVGSLVTVWLPTVAGEPAVSYRGRLLEPLPGGLGGWVVLEFEDKERIAIPAARVDCIRER